MASKGGLNSFTPSTPNQATALGAVAGPRGSAAASIRILVEFISQYDGGAIKKLNQEIAVAQKAEKNFNGAIQREKNKIAKLDHQINQGLTFRKSINQSELKILDATGKKQTDISLEVAKIDLLNTNINASLRKGAELNEVKERISKRDLAVAELHQKLKKNGVKLDEDAFHASYSLTTNEVIRERVEERLNNTLGRQALYTDEVAQKQAEVLRIEQLRAAVIGKIGGLLIGIASYTVVGAAFAVGFQAMQGAIDAVVNSLQLALDPLKDIRKLLPEINKEIEGLVSEKGLTRLEAAAELIDTKLGALAPALGTTADKLAEVAAIGALNEAIAELNELESLNKDVTEERKKAVEELVDILTEQAIAEYGNARAALEARGVPAAKSVFGIPSELGSRGVLEGLIRYGEVLPLIATYLGDVGTNAEEAAAAMEEIRLDNLEEQLEAAIDLKIAELEATRDLLMEAVNLNADNALAALEAQTAENIAKVEAIRDGNIKSLKTKLDALELKPSARTRGLENRLEDLEYESELTRKLAASIEFLSEREAKRNHQSELADIAEEKRLVRLQLRLSAQEREINIGRYSGQARVIALTAEAERLSEINYFQDRQIKQLEIIRALQTPLERKVGESVDAFVGRRSFENRKQLVESEKFVREGLIKTLNERKKSVESRVELAELEEERLEVIRKRNLELEKARLQERLERSKESDRAVLEAQREFLQKQLESSKKADQARLDAKKAALEEDIENEKLHAEESIAVIKKTEAEKQAKIEAEREEGLKTLDEYFEKEIKRWEAQGKDLVKLVKINEDETLKLAIQGAKNRNDFAILAGRVYGANLGKGQLEGVMEALGIGGEEAKAILDNANSVAARYEKEFNKQSFGRSQRQSYATGGIFSLTNGSSPFGQNARFGEQGQEIGVVLSNKVTQALKGSQGGPLINSISIETSENPSRANYKLRTLVRDVVRQEVYR